ncbi:hypothetical protein SESBI_38121, partial [Sesbania bispinosa]
MGRGGPASCGRWWPGDGDATDREGNGTEDERRSGRRASGGLRPFQAAVVTRRGRR